MNDNTLNKYDILSLFKDDHEEVKTIKNEEALSKEDLEKMFKEK